MKLQYFFIKTICLILFLSCFIGKVAFAEGQKLQILHTNDVHGHLAPFENPKKSTELIGGVAKRAWYIKNTKENITNTDLLILDAGDMAQGTLFYSMFKGKPDIQFMNQQGYNVAVTGNHEYDSGSKALYEMLKDAKFPVLASNLKFNKNSILANSFKPYYIVTFNNLKVGIIGIVPADLATLTNLEKGVKVLDPIKTAKKYIKKIDKQTDVIVLLTHIGFDQDKILAKNIKNADIIVGGHSHTLLEKPVIINDKNQKPVIIVQAGEYGKYLGDLKVEVENDSVKLLSYKSIKIDQSLKSIPEIKTKIDTLTQKVKDRYNTIIGKLKTPIDCNRKNVRSKENACGNFIADAIKKSFPEADIAFHNGGALRNDVIIESGNIYLKDIKSLYPYDDIVILYGLKGKDIKTVLERSVSYLPNTFGGFLQVSGITFDVDLSQTPQLLNTTETKIIQKGSRVSNIKINGEPIDKNKIYTIASSTFIFYGGNGFFTMKKHNKWCKNSNIRLIDMLEEYIIKEKQFSPVSENRINLIN